MVYITGDIHGGFDMQKLSSKELKKQGVSLSENDYVIITGDFGLPFLDSDYEKRDGGYMFWMKWFKDKPYTVLWIDGNHDNFNFWEKQEVSEWHGGRVQFHPEAQNVIHLMRGEVYDIEGRKYFAFGGAASIDKDTRTPNVSWWAREEANDDDIANAETNLAKCDYKVDVVLTHTMPCHLILTIEPSILLDRTAMYLSDLSRRIDYGVWLCGHFHKDKSLPYQRIAITYDKVRSIESFEREFAPLSKAKSNEIER